MTDPISDMLTRIRNAQAVCKETVSVPFSKFKFSLAEILLKNNYLNSVDSSGSGVKKNLIIKLKYKNNKPAIEHIKRISKPGQRIYVRNNEIYPILKGYGMSIISTSQGLMTNKDAKEKGLGGEVIVEIW